MADLEDSVLQDCVSEIESLSQSTEAQSDDLTRTLSRLSIAIDNLAARVGVPASITMPDGRGLHINRRGGRWGLRVEEPSYTLPESSSLETRMLVMRSLPTLLEAWRAALRARSESLQLGLQGAHQAHPEVILALLRTWARETSHGQAAAEVLDLLGE